MRLLIVAAAALMVPAAARAEPLLVGRSEPGAFRPVDARLQPAAGRPRLPASTFGTAVSPDRRRFVAFGELGSDITQPNDDDCD